jgi:acyl carrier protein
MSAKEFGAISFQPDAFGEQSPVEMAILGMLMVMIEDEQEFGIDDDLFALGADSITAAKLMNLICDRYGVEIDIGRAFENPTVRGLSALVDEALLASVERMSDTDAQRSLDPDPHPR